MAGHYTSITQSSGQLNKIARGTLVQPADDNVDVHIDIGFVPQVVIVSADPLGTVQLAMHTTDMTAGTSVNLITGEDLASAITIRNGWTVTVDEYFVRGGVSVQSTAGAETTPSEDDVIHGFSLGTNINGTDGDYIYYWALG